MTQKVYLKDIAASYEEATSEEWRPSYGEFEGTDVDLYEV